MTFAPQTIKDLAALWVGEGGVNLGIVGDAPHVLGGVSYHLGRHSLLPNAYSKVLPRDKAGLSDAASAIDLGRLDGSLGELQKFSEWLVAAIRTDQTKYRDVREVIYSPDGTAIRRWDNELKKLNVGGTGTGQGDNSHRTHTHISFYRDSEFRDKRALFAPYFAPKEPDLDSFNIPDRPQLLVLPAGTVIYDNSALAVSPGNYTLTAKELPLVGVFPSGSRIVAYEPTGATVPHSYFTKANAGTIKDVPPAPVPIPNCDPAVKTAVNAAIDKVRDALPAVLAGARP